MGSLKKSVDCKAERTKKKKDRHIDRLTDSQGKTHRQNNRRIDRQRKNVWKKERKIEIMWVMEERKGPA